jgi:hypothetical protein
MLALPCVASPLPAPPLCLSLLLLLIRPAPRYDIIAYKPLLQSIGLDRPTLLMRVLYESLEDLYLLGHCTRLATQVHRPSVKKGEAVWRVMAPRARHYFRYGYSRTFPPLH